MKTSFVSPPLNLQPRSAPETPFLRAGQEWDDRIGATVVQAKNWRLAFFSIAAVALSLSVIVAIQIKERKVIPVLVGIDKERGEPTVLGPVDPAEFKPTLTEIRYFLTQFIRFTRAVSVDQVVVKQNWLRAYAFLRRDAAALLNEMTEKDRNSPLKKIGQIVVTVQPISVVQIPGTQSFQARWRELVYSPQGTKLDDYTMLGTFSVEVEPPRDDQTLQENPLGLFIKSFQWNRELPSE